ncbi:hypothetical protein A2U01_0095711 [Trifolium medium]|uniref:Uncharacterized protein n=1 Tax=Trifolium medium TaxID=97028 RepID=A0A392UNW5_9FABA|nr:hypothetical protein [Trifolium medium]
MNRQGSFSAGGPSRLSNQNRGRQWTSLTIVLRTTGDLTVLGTKGLEGIKLERS